MMGSILYSTAFNKNPRIIHAVTLKLASLFFSDSTTTTLENQCPVLVAPSLQQVSGDDKNLWPDTRRFLEGWLLLKLLLFFSLTHS